MPTAWHRCASAGKQDGQDSVMNESITARIREIGERAAEQADTMSPLLPPGSARAKWMAE
jgi:hypothetical protein